MQIGKKFKRGPEVQDLPDYARVTHFLATLGFQVRTCLIYCLKLQVADWLTLPAVLDTHGLLQSTCFAFPCIVQQSLIVSLV